MLVPTSPPAIPRGHLRSPSRTLPRRSNSALGQPLPAVSNGSAGEKEKEKEKGANQPSLGQTEQAQPSQTVPQPPRHVQRASGGGATSLGRGPRMGHRLSEEQKSPLQACGPAKVRLRNRLTPIPDPVGPAGMAASPKCRRANVKGQLPLQTKGETLPDS